MIIGYLDTNTKNISLNEQRDILGQYAIAHKCSIDIFLEHNNILNILDNIQSSDCTLLLANAVCLGNSLLNVKEKLNLILRKVSKIVLISENIELSQSSKSQILMEGLELSIQIRNSLISITTKKALAAKKVTAKSAERKTRNKKRILDGKNDEIILRKLKGETNAHIAAALGVHEVTLYTYMRQNPALKNKLREAVNG